METTLTLNAPITHQWDSEESCDCGGTCKRCRTNAGEEAIMQANEELIMNQQRPDPLGLPTMTFNDEHPEAHDDAQQDQPLFVNNGGGLASFDWDEAFQRDARANVQAPVVNAPQRNNGDGPTGGALGQPSWEF